MAKRKKAIKVIKELIPEVIPVLFKVWLGGKAYRVSKEIFEMVNAAKSESEAIKVVNGESDNLD